MQKRLGIDVEGELEKIRLEIANTKVQTLESLRRLHNNPYPHNDDLRFVAANFMADLAGES